MSMKLEYQSYRSPQGWYQMIYPEFWVHEVIEEIPVFYDPDGSGALLVSAFLHKLGQYNIDLEVKNFLKQHGIEYNPEMIAKMKRADNSEIRACEFVSKGRFWMVYMLSFKNKLIVSSYNSDEAPDSELSSILSKMISSIHFLHIED
jgi:hypothetical protein